MTNPFARYLEPQEDPAEEPTEPAQEVQRAPAAIGPFYAAPVPYTKHEDGFVNEDDGHISGLVMAEVNPAFTGPGTKNPRGATPEYGLLPPNWPSYVRTLAEVDRANDLADRLAAGPRVDVEIEDAEGQTLILESFDWSSDLGMAYAYSLERVRRFMVEVENDVATAKGYNDPETGQPFHVLLRQNLDRDMVAAAARLTRQWEAAQEVTTRPLPSLDDDPGPQVIDGMLPEGGLAILTGPTDPADLLARLAEDVAGDEPFLGQTVMADEVVIIDTDATPSALLGRYSAALAMGAKVVPFRARPADLDVRDPAIRAWLAKAIPGGALVIVDSLPTLLGALEISETSSEAGGYLAAWRALAAESKAAGVIVVHGSPESNPGKPRGHGSLGTIPDTLWVLKNQTLTVDRTTTYTLMDAGGPSRPAEPGEREEAGRDKPSRAEETRRAIRDCLCGSDLPASTSAVASYVGLSLPGVTRHLEALEKEGVVGREKGRGRTILWHATQG